MRVDLITFLHTALYLGLYSLVVLLVVLLASLFILRTILYMILSFPIMYIEKNYSDSLFRKRLQLDALLL